MADSVISRLQTLSFSYREMEQMGFNPQFTEDYLNQLQNMVLVANEIDIDKAAIESNTLRLDIVEPIVSDNVDRLDIVEPIVTNNTDRLDIVEPIVTSNTGRLNLVEPIAAANAAAIALASGQLVGNNDFATVPVGGVVNLMALVADAVDSLAEITIVDIGAAPALYDQTYTQSVTDLLNDTKAKHNQLRLDLNLVVTQLNELLDNSITAKQMAAV